MKINDDHLKYLSGQLFHSGYNFPVADTAEHETTVANRFDLIEHVCAGKSVLHIGCADHLELIDAKRLSGSWIHGHLSKVSRKCMGIDINREAIDYLKNQLGIDNVLHADIIENVPQSILQSSPWDQVFLGEIIEHVNEPVKFLQSIKNKLDGCAKELLVTAPNAMRWQNFKKIREGLECINSDHRFWFSPYTLAKIVLEAGFKPVEFYFVTANKIPKPAGVRSYFRYRRLLRVPGFRETIFLRAEF